MDAWQLSFLETLLLVGVLLLGLSLSSAYMRRLPISTAAIYLLLGTLLGPWGFNALVGDTISPAKAWFERATEIAVIASLFVGGLKLRLPFRSPAWSAALRLAGPVMLCTIGLLALVGHFALGLDIASALLLGAILAPTDPVLASAISIHRATDEDYVRFGLSGEAGLNDGMAFPFVMFGLAWAAHQGPGSWIAEWTLHRVLWAVPAGLGFGYALGRGVGRLAVWLRSHNRDPHAPTDFLAMALIALSYVGAEWIGAWGFLSTFAAGLGLRGAELRVVSDTPHPEYVERQSRPNAHPPAETMVPANATASHVEAPAVAAGLLIAETISFGETLERVLEVVLVALVGMSLATHWDPRALVLALVLFVIIRPLGTHLSLLGSPTDRTQRWMLGWFGIRGIGSLYYLSYSLRHGLEGASAGVLANLTISVIAISIVAHGITSRPLLRRYELSRERSAGERRVRKPQRE